jgi:hypothetical protein
LQHRGAGVWVQRGFHPGYGAADGFILGVRHLRFGDGRAAPDGPVLGGGRATEQCPEWAHCCRAAGGEIWLGGGPAVVW